MKKYFTFLCNLFLIKQNFVFLAVINPLIIKRGKREGAIYPLLIDIYFLDIKLSNT